MTTTHAGYDFPDWVRGIEIYKIAISGTGSKKFTVDNFAKGSDAIFTIREFYALRDILEDCGLFSPIDKDDLLKGFEWTEKGLVFLREILGYYAHPLSPTEE